MALTSGTKLGPYEIQSSIGAGGMGEVYRSRDARLHRDVAIKVLPASFSADRDRLQRFAQEARAAAALNHPNILSIYDIGDENGAPYVVSELLEGETLRERLRSGPVPIRKAIDYALQIARGLAAAHEKGIVHRDLKPENIFVTSDGRVKILDFGLAKLTRPENTSTGADEPTMQAATEPGMVMGTVGYMSPEQVRGKNADARSDIFSFGAILFEMISGKRAFHGETPADTMSAILKEEVPELSETSRNVPPGLDRIVRHCLEKSPVQRFHSAGDLAFDLEALTEISSTSKSDAQAAVAQADVPSPSRKLPLIAAVLALLAAAGAIGWWVGRGAGPAAPPEYQQITFRTGNINDARFTPDGSIVYNATWDGGGEQLYMARTTENGSRELGIKDADVLSISQRGELALRLNTHYLYGYSRTGTLARVALSGGTPREVLDNVQDADWAADSENLAVVRYVPGVAHWRLEYPVGKALYDGINWISQPRISPDGKWVAFADHENVGGDDQGSIALVGPDGREKKLASGFVSIEGIAWSPSGKEVWFTATRTGSATNLHGVTLDGKERAITNVPGGMWLQDVRDGVALMVAHQIRIGIRGTSPGAKEERELGWFNWGILRDMSRDGKKILFEEEGDGGGAGYTVFLRDTDGSPPIRLGEGLAGAISPDGKWVVTSPKKDGVLAIVPTGAGEARPLTHDKISFSAVRYLPDGKHLLATGIESGHGVRNYLIDANTGDSKPVTPEGTSGIVLSRDGRLVAVTTSDGTYGIWSLEDGSFRAIPGWDPQLFVAGWATDQTSLYAAPKHRSSTTEVFRVNIQTGKKESWKTFGEHIGSGISGISPPLFSDDGSAYAYIYSQVLSVAYVVRGLK